MGEELAVVGLGKLGLPLALVFAKAGFEVYGIDISEQRIKEIQIYRSRKCLEPKVTEYLQEYCSNFKLSTDYQVLKDVPISIVITQTPSLSDGHFDISYVERVVRNIHNINKEALIVVSSNINIGSIDKLSKIHRQICYNPEFIAQGTIIHDFENPRFVLIGTYTKEDGEQVANIWRKVHDKPIYIVKPVEAEIIKLSSNVSFTLGITFANMIGELCEKFDADSNKVLDIIYQDKRNYKAGLGYMGPCLSPSVNVQTINGLKPISQVKEGDYVLSRTGQWQKVTKTYKTFYNGKIIKLKHQGVEVGVTPEHLVLGRVINCPNPYFVRSRGKLRKSSDRRILPLSWKAINDIKDDFLFAFPIPLFSKGEKEEHIVGTHYKRAVEFSPSFMRIIGYYLAGGWVNKEHHTIEFSFNSKETEYIKDLQHIFDEVFGLKLSTHRLACAKTAVRLRNGCKPLAEFLLSTIGSGADKKQIPIKWLNTSRQNRIELLKGLFRGDGNFSQGVTKEGFNQATFTYATFSHELFNQVKLILLDLGIAFSSRVVPPHEIHKKSYWIKINGSYYQKLKRIFGMNYKQHPKKGKASQKENWVHNGHLLSPIQENKVKVEQYRGFVYNLEVEGDNSYCLESITVHNCFPRDVDCFKATALENSSKIAYRFACLLKELNDYIVEKHIQEIKSFGKKRIGILGIAYKPNVPYLYESQPLKIAQELHADGHQIFLYDPSAQENAKQILKNTAYFCDTVDECIDEAEIIFIGTSNYSNIQTDKPKINPWK